MPVFTFYFFDLFIVSISIVYFYVLNFNSDFSLIFGFGDNLSGSEDMASQQSLREIPICILTIAHVCCFCILFLRKLKRKSLCRDWRMWNSFINVVRRSIRYFWVAQRRFINRCTIRWLTLIVLRIWDLKVRSLRVLTSWCIRIKRLIGLFIRIVRTPRVNNLEWLLVRRIKNVRGCRIVLFLFSLFLRWSHGIGAYWSNRFYFQYVKIEGILLINMDSSVMNTNIRPSLILHLKYWVLISDRQLSFVWVEGKTVGLSVQGRNLPPSES